jgi:hypothetical protein
VQGIAQALSILTLPGGQGEVVLVDVEVVLVEVVLVVVLVVVPQYGLLRQLPLESHGWFLR